MTSLSIEDARRVVLAAQGFTGRRRERPTAVLLRKSIDQLGLLQIDSVNVLTRAHYLPAFSRIGSFDRTLLERDAWGPKSQRHLFEYWAHEASLLPLDLHPLLRWRMARAERGEIGYRGLKRFACELRPQALEVLDRIRSEGALAAADFENGPSKSGWWEWSQTKHALEWLFWAGKITTATRRGSFVRVYDLPERVLPSAVLDLPTPEVKSAQRALIERSARALGVATAADLRDYFRLKPDEADQGTKGSNWGAQRTRHPDAVRAAPKLDGRIEDRAVGTEPDGIRWPISTISIPWSPSSMTMAASDPAGRLPVLQQPAPGSWFGPTI